MNIARVGLLVVAIAAAGAAAILVRTLTHKSGNESTARAGTSTMQVLVAARELEPGAIMKAGDLRWQAWPQESLSPSFMTQKALPKALDTAMGSTLRVHLDTGEPVIAGKLIKADGSGLMALMLSPGMRAISTKIDENTAAGYFIQPGDHVDVVMTRKADRKGGGSSKAYESKTVLTDVRVLAIGQTIESDTANDKSATKTNTAKSATLELSPAQAEALALANAMGKLVLVLRAASSAEGLTAATEPAPAPVRLENTGKNDGTIYIVRYAHESRLVPSNNTSGDGQ